MTASKGEGNKFKVDSFSIHEVDEDLRRPVVQFLEFQLKAFRCDQFVCTLAGLEDLVSCATGHWLIMYIIVIIVVQAQDTIVTGGGLDGYFHSAVS